MCPTVVTSWCLVHIEHASRWRIEWQIWGGRYRTQNRLFWFLKHNLNILNISSWGNLRGQTWWTSFEAGHTAALVLDVTLSLSLSLENSCHQRWSLLKELEWADLGKPRLAYGTQLLTFHSCHVLCDILLLIKLRTQIPNQSHFLGRQCLRKTSCHITTYIK